MRTVRFPIVVTVASTILLGSSGFGPVAARAENVEGLLRFGTEMAQRGNWREAAFRWEQAAKLDPENGRIANNLAVASEALGDRERARSCYQKALAAASTDGRIQENVARAARAWKRSGSDTLPVPTEHMADGHGSKKGHDSIEVEVELSLPPRLDLTGTKSLLVASFLVEETDLLDPNREIVRFIRSEFRKHSALQILDVTPPPAVPEQTLEDLVANAAFWSHLGREFAADVVVSGMLRYSRRDASGFKDVDVVSEETGQKVRQTRFVEQEQFVFDVDVLFFRGASGELLYKDRLKREAIFPGLANDPITAFYRLAESIAGDVRAVVSPRTVPEHRWLFRS